MKNDKLSSMTLRAFFFLRRENLAKNDNQIERKTQLNYLESKCFRKQYLCVHLNGQYSQIFAVKINRTFHLLEVSTLQPQPMSV